MPDVTLSKPDKVLFPAADGHDEITKADVFDYAGRIADRMIPLIADRPAVLQRFPDGIDGDGWYQKHTPNHFPDWIPTVELPKRGGTVRHPVIDSADALRYIVNQGTVSVHVLGGTVDRPGIPAELLIDLDPSIDDPAQVIAAANAVRELLDDLAVTGFVKTTGSRGIHVHVPLRGDAGFDAVGALVATSGGCWPTATRISSPVAFSKDERGDRLFVDTLRNAPAQHAVAPYTLRPRPGAPVAVPLRWDEIDATWRPGSTPLRSLFRRLGALDGRSMGRVRRPSRRGGDHRISSPATRALTVAGRVCNQQATPSLMRTRHRRRPSWTKVGAGRLSTMPSVDVNGITIEYERTGAGEPLLLIMGLGAQLTAWPVQLVDALVGRGYEVIRFDNRDIGLSSTCDWEPPSPLRAFIGRLLPPSRAHGVRHRGHGRRRRRPPRCAGHRLGPRRRAHRWAG